MFLRNYKLTKKILNVHSDGNLLNAPSIKILWPHRPTPTNILRGEHAAISSRNKLVNYFPKYSLAVAVICGIERGEL